MSAAAREEVIRTRSIANQIVVALALLVQAAGASAATDLTPESLVSGIGSTLIYSVVGIAMAALGFKVIDWLTPGDLHAQIGEHENRALALVTSAMILGVCIIIAAVISS